MNRTDTITAAAAHPPPPIPCDIDLRDFLFMPPVAREAGKFPKVVNRSLCWCLSVACVHNPGRWVLAKEEAS
jgi:hypothetical protein